MKFERARNHHRKATLELDPETKFHEAYVAIKALGTLTGINSHSPEKRRQSYMLANKIAAGMKALGGSEDLLLVDLQIPMLKDKAVILGQGLQAFAATTEMAINQSLTIGNPAGCNERATEGDMAETMLAQLVEEFGALPAPTKQPFGFR